RVARDWGSAIAGSAGLTSRAISRAVGTSSYSSCRSFGAVSTFNWVTPVTLPPGRLRLVTRPIWIGSDPVSKTTGMTVVAALAARAAGLLVAATHLPVAAPDRRPLPAVGLSAPQRTGIRS